MNHGDLAERQSGKKQSRTNNCESTHSTLLGLLTAQVAGGMRVCARFVHSVRFNRLSGRFGGFPCWGMGMAQAAAQTVAQKPHRDCSSTPHILRVQASCYRRVSRALDDRPPIWEKCHLKWILPELQYEGIVTDAAMGLQSF